MQEAADRVGPGGGVVPGDAAVHDRLAKPQRQGHRPIFRARVAGGVVVPGAGHAGDIRVEAVAVPPAQHFLDDHGHFLADARAGGRPVGASPAKNVEAKTNLIASVSPWKRLSASSWLLGIIFVA